MAIRYVPSQDYPTIQAGVDAAIPGDVVYVRSGFYTETITVSTSSIRIIAQKKPAVILKANNESENPFTLNDVTNVEISGFVIQKSLRGIFVYRGGYHRIIGNIMQNSGEGVLTEDSVGNFIYRNYIRYNRSVGVLLGWNIGSTSNWVVENLITGNGSHGVEVWSAVNANNAIIRNKLFANNGDGVKVNSPNTLVYGNEVKGNQLSGINFASGDYSVAAGNVVEKNASANIDISSSYAIAIDNCVVEDGIGIDINGNYNIVQANNVEDNRNGGINIDGTNNTVIYNELENNRPQNIDDNGTDNNILCNDTN